MEKKTDVAQLWRQHGWLPPSQLPEYQKKWEESKNPFPEEVIEINWDIDLSKLTCRPSK
jgi:hypothetical protein